MSGGIIFKLQKIVTSISSHVISLSIEQQKYIQQWRQQSIKELKCEIWEGMPKDQALCLQYVTCFCDQSLSCKFDLIALQKSTEQELSPLDMSTSIESP